MTDYWKNALIRGARTFVQSALAILMANQTGMFEVNVLMAAGMAGATAAVSIFQNALEDYPAKFMSKIPKG